MPPGPECRDVLQSGRSHWSDGAVLRPGEIDSFGSLADNRPSAKRSKRQLMSEGYPPNTPRGCRSASTPHATMCRVPTRGESYSFAHGRIRCFMGLHRFSAGKKSSRASCRFAKSPVITIPCYVHHTAGS